MPTYTHVALDQLLEPNSRRTLQKPPPAPIKLERAPTPIPSPRKPILRRQLAPALYATPETTAVPPDSPSSPSSYPPASPYIINHKRRGPRLLKSQSLGNDDGGSRLSEVVTQSQAQAQTQAQDFVPVIEEEEAEADIPQTEQIDGGEDEIEEIGQEIEEGERTVERDEFIDLQESMSVASEDGYSMERSWKPSTPIGEFYDAFEEISSESGAAASTPAANRYTTIEEELREIRLSLLVEIEKRKQAEEALESLKNQWTRLSHHLNLIGLHLPPLPPHFTEKSRNYNGSKFELDPAEELSQQIIASRFVSDEIARGISRAEMEAEMGPIVQSKNFEISRLMDRVQYYEAANREMSQRNQEAVEMARQQRNRRKRRQKWILASIGLAATIGTVAMALSYLPNTNSVLTEQQNSSSTVHTNQN